MHLFPPAVNYAKLILLIYPILTPYPYFIPFFLVHDKQQELEKGGKRRTIEDRKTIIHEEYR